MSTHRISKRIVNFVLCFLLLVICVTNANASFGEKDTPKVELYIDYNYGLSLEIPEDLTQEILINDPIRKDGVILKRLEITASTKTDGFLIDIFPIDPEMRLTQWYQKHGKIFASNQNTYDMSSRIDGELSIYTYNPVDLFPRHTFFIKHRDIVIRFDYEVHKVDLFESFINTIETIQFVEAKQGNINKISGFVKRFRPVLNEETLVQTCCGYTDPNPNHYECGRTGNCVWWAKYKRPDTGGTASNSWGNANLWAGRAQQEGFPVNNSVAADAVACWDGAPFYQNHVSYVESYNPSTLIARMSDMDWESPNHGCIAEYWNQQSDLSSLKYIHKKSVVAPNPPSGLSATDGTYNDRVQVSWNASSGATRYEVYRATSSGGTKTLIGNPTATTYADTSVTPGVTYWYFVKACNSAGCSGFSTGDSGYASIPIPGTVTLEVPSLSPAAGPTCSTGWYELTNDRGHPFYLTLNTNVQSQSTNSATWTPNLGVEGKYRVEAYIAYHPVINWPCPPYPTASWDTSDARYAITHAGGTTNKVGNQAPLNNQWLDLGSYQFNAGTGGKVRLTDLNGEANLTKTIQFGAMRFVLLTPYGAPQNVSATDGNFTDRVRISWSAVTGATSYLVFKATSASGTKTHIGTPTGTSYDDTSVTPGTTYYYWVKACNSHGCSGFSAVDSGYAAIPIPAIPTGVNASDGTFTDRVQITWNAVTGANSYQVFRADSASGTKTQLGTSNTANYSDTTVVPGTTYWYFVKACNDSGCSDYSSGDSGYAAIPIPAIPTGVNASDGTFTDKVEITWNTVSGATSYQIYRADSASGAKTQIGTSSTANYSDATVVPGTTYWYFIKACNGSGCSDYSSGDSGYAAIPIPAIPTGVNASDGTFTDRVQISWNAVSGATSYQIYRADSASGAKTQIGTSSTANYSDATVVPGTTYWYFIKACNGSGCSDYSSGDSGYAAIPIPAIPTGVNASDGTFTDRVQISWNAVSGATSYQIYRADSASGAKTQIGTSSTANYSDATVVPGTTYWYFIKACNGSGCSDYSSGDSGYAAIPIPAIPTGVNASDGTFTDHVQISWDAVSGATSYQVYRADSASGAKTQIGTSNTANYSDTTVVPGTTYWYFVKACNDSGCSDYSSGDSGYAAIPIPAIPTGVNASDGTFTDRVQITWNAVSGANSYQVFRAFQEDGSRSLIGNSDTLEFNDTNAVINIVYWYWVKACNSSGCSEFSLGDSGFAAYPSLDPPVNVIASDGTFLDKVEISWNIVLDTEQYKVFRADSPESDKLEIGSASENNFFDTSAAPGVVYWYYVKACNSAGCSEFSEGDSGFRYLATPIAPTSLTASDGLYSDFVKLNWSASQHANTYQIYRSVGPNEVKELIVSVETTSFNDTEVDRLTMYWYWVKACNISGCSEFSEPDSGYAAPVPKPYKLLIPMIMKR